VEYFKVLKERKDQHFLKLKVELNKVVIKAVKAELIQLDKVSNHLDSMVKVQEFRDQKLYMHQDKKGQK